MFRGERAPGSLWTDKDRTAALMLSAFEDSKCPGCGQRADLSMDPNLSEAWHCTEAQCFACETRDIVAERVSKNEANKAPGAFRYSVELKQLPWVDGYLRSLSDGGSHGNNSPRGEG